MDLMIIPIRQLTANQTTPTSCGRPAERQVTRYDSLSDLTSRGHCARSVVRDHMLRFIIKRACSRTDEV